jgi:UDP-glucose 4-epimerase
MKNKVLVTGGAGYIGSHTVLELILEGKYEVISIDNYSNSNAQSLLDIETFTGKKIEKIEVDLCDYTLVEKSLAPFENQIVGIIHFAALKAVGESVDIPVKYYQNNLNSMLNVLRYCEEKKVQNFIFSSSCSVYGDVSPELLPVSERTTVQTTQSPYAETKSMGERILKDVASNNKLKALSLRYFNPVGSHQNGLLGENPKAKPNSLVPVICKSALGLIPTMSVFGDDYDTRDGSCIRDYIHVVDIAKAHVKALNYLVTTQKDNYDVINLGSGNGVSVLEAIDAFEKASGQSLKYNLAPRRAGDVVSVYSDSSKAKNLLGWTAELGIDVMMSTAWAWENKLANK